MLRLKPPELRKLPEEELKKMIWDYVKRPMYENAQRAGREVPYYRWRASLKEFDYYFADEGIKMWHTFLAKLIKEMARERGIEFEARNGGRQGTAYHLEYYPEHVKRIEEELKPEQVAF
jgi:hypothetical protein